MEFLSKNKTYRIKILDFDFEVNGDIEIPFDEPNDIIHYNTNIDPSKKEIFSDNFALDLQERISVDTPNEARWEKFNVSFEILGELKNE